MDVQTQGSELSLLTLGQSLARLQRLIASVNFACNPCNQKSAEEADELTDTLRHQRGDDEKVIITTYRDIRLVRNNLLERGKYFLTNELPETGS